MTDIAIIPNNLTCVTYMLAIVTAKTPGGIEVSDVIRVSGPIRLHLRKKVGPENALRLADCRFKCFRFLRGRLAVVVAVKRIEI